MGLFCFFIISCLFTCCFYLYHANNDDIEIKELINIGTYNKKLLQFEEKQRIYYPIDSPKDKAILRLIDNEIENDSLYISHGSSCDEVYCPGQTGTNYFNFFNRIGKPMMLGCFDKCDKLVGIGCGVFKEYKPYLNLNNYSYTWYICGVKIDKEHQGKRLPYKMLKNKFATIKKCDKYYGISMDKKDKTGKTGKKYGESRMISICKKIGLFDYNNVIYLFALNKNEMMVVQNLLKLYFGKIGYLSLDGIKDIILTSTNLPIKLLHVQWGFSGQFIGPRCTDSPQDEYIHMFCLHEKNPLLKKLIKMKLPVHASATIIHHNMNGTDWNFLLTSDI